MVDHLVLDIIEDHFGSTPKSICAVLADKIELSLEQLRLFYSQSLEQEDLQRSTTEEDYTNSIKALLLHDILSVFQKSRSRQKKPTRKRTRPSENAELDNPLAPEGSEEDTQVIALQKPKVLFRLRFPDVIETCRVLAGDDGALLAYSFILEGKAPLSRLIDTASHLESLSLLSSPILSSPLSLPSSSSSSSSSSLGPSPASVQLTRRIFQAFAKLNKLGFISRVIPHPEYQQSTPSTRIHEFNLDQETGESYLADPSLDQVAKDLISFTKVLGTSNLVLWSLDSPKFKSYWKMNQIVSYLSEKLGPPAGSVIRSIFQICELKGGGNMSIDIQELRSKVNDVSKSEITEYLRMIEGEDFLSLTSDNRTVFPRLQNISRKLKSMAIEASIKEKFGEVSLRIFRLLQQKSQMEDRQIAEIVLRQAKEVRQRLYGMLCEDFVVLQEVPKSSDWLTEGFFLWTSSPERATIKLIQEIAIIIKRLRMRLKFESSSIPADSLSVDHQKTEKRETFLNVSILRLSNTLLTLMDD